MKKIRRIILGVFLGVWTLALGAYIFVMLLGSDTQKQTLYSLFPPTSYVSWFFGLDTYPDRSSTSTDAVWDASNNWSSNASPDDDPSSLRFDDEASSFDLYSPVHTFVGELSSDVVWFEVVYDHKSLDDKITIDLWEYVNDTWVWTRDIWLQDTTLQQWKNTYTFVATLQDWKKIKKNKKITVDYEEIEIDGTTLYLDPYFSLDGKNITWQEDDFDGIPTSFLMKGCGEADQKVLIQREYVFEQIPSCLTYSTKKKYLAYFDNKRETQEWIYYNVISPGHGIIYKNFPLFQRKRGNIFQSLLFFNPGGQFIQIVSALWDQNNFETLIQHYNVRSGITTMSLRQVNGDQVEIENGYEKIILYYFKDNQSKRSITYPGLRYKYYVKRSGNRRLIRQWTTYHLDQQVRIPPTQEFGTSYRLNAWLYEDEVVVEDPFRHVTYNITSLAQPKSIENVPESWFVCKDATIWVYSYLWGDVEYLYEDDNVILMWSDRDVDHVGIEDDEGSSFEVSQHTQWYVATTIEPSQRWTQVWDRTYTIIWYDANGREVCKKSHTIEILEKPVY